MPVAAEANAAGREGNEGERIVADRFEPAAVVTGLQGDWMCWWRH